MAKRVIWSDEATADIRRIDRETALQLLKSIDRFLKTDVGDQKQLQGFYPPTFRLRYGTWRVIFRHEGEGAIKILHVRHRREAYR